MYMNQMTVNKASESSSDNSKKTKLRAKFLNQDQPNVQISNTYQYFLKNVDPLFGELISKILLLQPVNIDDFLVSYFKSVKDSKPFEWSESDKNAKEMALSRKHFDPKLYFNQNVAPIVTKLIKDVAIKKPVDMVDFLYVECCNQTYNTSKITQLPIMVPSSSNTSLKPTHGLTQVETLIQSSTVSSSRPSSARGLRSKLDDAKSLAESITVNSPSKQSISRNKIENALNLAESVTSNISPRKDSIARNKIENAISYEVMIQNNVGIQSALLNSSTMITSEHVDNTIHSQSTTDIPQVSSKPAHEVAISHNTTENIMKQQSASDAVVELDAPTKTIEAIKPIVIEKKKAVQIALLGLGCSGKTTMINLLQNIVTKPKPTVGFRPITLGFDKDMKVQIYDLGGGDKIRGIWNQYYHDIHAVIYVIDVSSTEAEKEKSVDSLIQVITHTYCKNKPLLIFLNKIDLVSDVTIIDTFKTSLRERLSTVDTSSIIKIIPVTALAKLKEEPLLSEEESASMSPRTPEIIDYDKNIETYIESILNDIKHNYDEINERVNKDMLIKLKEDTMKRLEREKNVLKTKIALAFYEQIDMKILNSMFQVINENDEIDMSIFYGDRGLFDEQEGLDFLASEMSDENNQPAHLPPLAHEICKLIGFQSLAMQIVGGFVKPTNKKRIALTWEEVYDIVIELRASLGINN